MTEQKTLLEDIQRQLNKAETVKEKLKAVDLIEKKLKDEAKKRGFDPSKIDVI